MHPKSRRNRRNVSTKRKILSGAQSEISSNDNELIETASDQRAFQTAPDAKSSLSPEIDTSYVVKEIKWIAITTTIVAVILAISYIFLK